MAARKRPAKKAAAKKKAAPRKTVAQKRAAEQERALVWATTYSSPLIILEGWNPKTGEWSSKSPIGKMLERLTKGGHVETAAKPYGIRKPNELLRKGREYLSQPEVSEDRELVPMEIRPFVDLALAVDAVEAEVELSAVEAIYDKIAADPRLGLTFLARRFPDRWREQQEVYASVEYDPREAAIREMLNDPNTAQEMARFAREASRRAAALDVEAP